MNILDRFKDRYRNAGLICTFAFLFFIMPTSAADVSLTADDAMGETSFNSSLHWSNSTAPVAGNDYFTNDYRLRTPPDGNSYTFAGSSLTVNNTNGYSWGLFYKGTGSSGVITIPNLILDGGLISHANGIGDLCQLDGAITVNSQSTIYAKQGNIDVLADVSGSADLIIPQADNPSEDNRYVTFYGSINNYSGDFNIAGRFRLADAGSITFTIGADGVNNSLSGTGYAVYNGVFNFDLSAAGTNPGDSWIITSVANQTFGATFSINGFTEVTPGIWDGPDYWFDVASGVLSYGEPPTLTGIYLNTGGDSIGNSSFDNDGNNNWSDGLDPSSGNDYIVNVQFLRSPPDSLDYVFQGDSLTLRTGGAIISKHSGSRTLTANWILDGGFIRSGSGDGLFETLAGTMEVTANGGEIRADQTPYVVSADISGEGTLSLTNGSGVAFTGTSTLAGNVTATGSNLEWRNTSSWLFDIGPSGVNNQIAGSGNALFNGTFVFDLTDATSSITDEWAITAVASQSFGSNFAITGFTEDSPGIWTNSTYWFNEGTGMLTVAQPPEPMIALPAQILNGSSEFPNGAWSWYEDERCIIDANSPEGPRLLVSSVSSAPNGDPESGDIDLAWLDLVSGTAGHFEFANRLERDDHDSAALWLRPDGHYLAVYSKHTSDLYTRYRISTNPNDPTAWNAEQNYTHSANATYNNLHYLPDDNGGAGRLYNFTRAINWDPTVMTSDDYGSTWSSGGKLMTMGGTSDRPYVRYFSNGDRIHFITTEEHPRDFDNSIYHGYVKDGGAYNSDGTIIDSNIFDANGVTPNSFTTVMATGETFGGVPMHHAWTIDVAIDGDDPVVMFTARANNLNTDHRFFYARHAQATGWTVYPHPGSSSRCLPVLVRKRLHRIGLHRSRRSKRYRYVHRYRSKRQHSHSPLRTVRRANG